MSAYYDTDYYYAKGKDGKLFRFAIEPDEYPSNPRRDWDNEASHLMCWYKGYDLGDKHDYSDPDDFFNTLIWQEYKAKKSNPIINYVRKNKTTRNIQIKYNRSEWRYELYADGQDWKTREIVSQFITWENELDLLEDAVLEELTYSDKIKMLERKGYYFIPVNVYEHSGITMYTGSRWNHYDAQWDCSEVGWIYTSKTELIKARWGYRNPKTGKTYTATKNNWRKAADYILESEVEIYDMYLTGDVYAIREDVYDFDVEDWVDIEPWCGDMYYNTKTYGFGEERVHHMICDITSCVTKDDFISEEEMNTEIEKQLIEHRIMSQADYAVAI